MRHPLSLEAFVEWASTFPADREYNYGDVQGCLGYQFVKAQGLPIRSFDTNGWYDQVKFERHVLDERFVPVVVRSPHSFGAAVLRARELLEA